MKNLNLNLFNVSAFFILLVAFSALAAPTKKLPRNYYECNKVHGAFILGWHSHIMPAADAVEKREKAVEPVNK